jgi:Putative beta-barrel porin-2, OmpL-like. bbp2
MRTGTGPSGLVKIASGALALLVGAFASAAKAADGPGTTPPAATSAASAEGGTVAVATTGTTGTSPDDPKPADAPPDFLHSIQVDGFVDGYYGWAFNKVGPQLRNFDINHNNFSLNYVELAISKAPTDKSRAGFRVDFGAGDTANLVNLFEPGGKEYLKYVQQAYVSYLVPAGKGLSIDFGKFVTPAGAEVIENKDNFNYSRGLLFALAIPYYHMGARIGYAVNDKVSLTGYLVNGWNDVIDNNSDKTVGASLNVKPNAKTGIIVNYLVGKEQNADADGGTRNLVDVVVSYAANAKTSLLFNYDYGHDNITTTGPADETLHQGVTWQGVAFGLKYQANDKWAFSPRYEYYNDADGFSTGTEQNLQEVTLTGEYKTPVGLLARFEFRSDFSNKEFFVKDSGATTKTQPTVSVSLIYAFSSKQ